MQQQVWENSEVFLSEMSSQSPNTPLTPGPLTLFSQMGVGFLPTGCFSMGQASLTLLVSSVISLLTRTGLVWKASRLTRAENLLRVGCVCHAQLFLEGQTQWQWVASSWSTVRLAEVTRLRAAGGLTQYVYGTLRKTIQVPPTALTERNEAVSWGHWSPLKEIPRQRNPGLVFTRYGSFTQCG